jgi:hypothetical protein
MVEPKAASRAIYRCKSRGAFLRGQLLRLLRQQLSEFLPKLQVAREEQGQGQEQESRNKAYSPMNDAPSTKSDAKRTCGSKVTAV